MKDTTKYTAENGLLTSVSTRPLNKGEFVCAGCNGLQKLSLYAIAQQAMGHRMVFTCPTCEHKTNL